MAIRLTYSLQHKRECRDRHHSRWRGLHLRLYGSHNNLISVTYPDTTSRAYSYANASYTIDNANRITGLTETSLSNKTFGYDSLDRLTSFMNGSATTGYAYDANSNRSSTTIFHWHDDLQLSLLAIINCRASSGLVSSSFSYDSDGHMTGDGTNTWAYDARAGVMHRIRPLLSRPAMASMPSVSALPRAARAFPAAAQTNSSTMTRADCWVSMTAAAM